MTDPPSRPCTSQIPVGKTQRDSTAGDTARGGATERSLPTHWRVGRGGRRRVAVPPPPASASRGHAHTRRAARRLAMGTRWVSPPRAPCRGGHAGPADAATPRGAAAATRAARAATAATRAPRRGQYGRWSHGRAGRVLRLDGADERALAAASVGELVVENDGGFLPKTAGRRAAACHRSPSASPNGALPTYEQPSPAEQTKRG